MAMSAGKSDGEPMMEMNTTPLIDVMLCLLIMFIMSIPVATHSIDIDLPVATPPTDTPPPIDPVKNKIVLTQDSKVMWNGTQIDQGRLVQTL
jgi:biopolymer transport protein ExbD